MTDIEKFKEAMAGVGIASQVEQAKALVELIGLAEANQAEIDRVEEMQDQGDAGLSCRIDDLEKDHNETKDIPTKLSADVSGLVNPTGV